MENLYGVPFQNSNYLLSEVVLNHYFCNKSMSRKMFLWIVGPWHRHIIIEKKLSEMTSIFTKKWHQGVLSLMSRMGLI